LVAGDTNGKWDIFVHDSKTGNTSRVSVSSAGVQGNDQSDFVGISAHGRYVAFTSYANNLVAGDTNAVTDAFVHDRKTGKTARVSVNSAGVQGNQDSATSMISAHGRYVAFNSLASNLVAGDTNGLGDAFVHDRKTGKTTRVSVSSAGEQGNFGSSCSTISSDGRYVAFESIAGNLVARDTNKYADIFVRDLGAHRDCLDHLGMGGDHGDHCDQ
jgi:Tol biopolymer transport system component